MADGQALAAAATAAAAAAAAAIVTTGAANTSVSGTPCATDGNAPKAAEAGTVKSPTNGEPQKRRSTEERSATVPLPAPAPAPAPVAGDEVVTAQKRQRGNDQDGLTSVESGSTVVATAAAAAAVAATTTPVVAATPTAPPPPPPLVLPARVMPQDELCHKLSRLGDADGEEHNAKSKISLLAAHATRLLHNAAANGQNQQQSSLEQSLAAHVVECARNMPHKAPLYACFVGVVSATASTNGGGCGGDGDGGGADAGAGSTFAAAVVIQTLAALERSLLRQVYTVVKGTVRFLASLYDANVIRWTGLWSVLNSLLDASDAALTRVLELRGDSNNSASGRGVALASDSLLKADALMCVCAAGDGHARSVRLVCVLRCFLS